MSMEPDVTKQLLDLNASFYQTFATEFSATRQRIQPGVMRLVNEYFFLRDEKTEIELTDHAQKIHVMRSILDLGCGNGGLYLHLASLGFDGFYSGLDFSSELLEIARHRLEEAHGKNASFQLANLADINLADLFPVIWFDFVLAFAALHHLPGTENRLGLLRQIRDHIAPGGRFIHSEWQFQRSPRWTKRILPWEQVGLTDEDVEPGDCLLDWRSTGGKKTLALRYVHHFSEEELAGLAEAAGFRLIDSFYSDGREGDLSLYQVWEALS